MNVFASAAVTADGYLDNSSGERLIISTPEDWAEVFRLRALQDAILVGAETLRRDNPSLVIREEEVRMRRLLEGRNPDLVKVTVTATGRLTPDMNFFTRGQGEKIVFSLQALPQLIGAATVIVSEKPLTAKFIVTELEKRGIERLFIEGGAKTLKMFLKEDLVDTLRLAVNPDLQLGEDADAPQLDIAWNRPDIPCICEHFGNMEVTTYTLHADTHAEDLKYLRLAVELSRNCTPAPTSYCVGAVVVTAYGETFTGYTHETSATHHAEQEAITKAIAAGADLCGASMYSSMEPCSTRQSEPESCSALLLRLGFSKVVFALYEPDCFVNCRGALNLREQGVDVRVYPSLADEVRKVNAHLLK